VICGEDQVFHIRFLSDCGKLKQTGIDGNDENTPFPWQHWALGWGCVDV